MTVLDLPFGITVCGIDELAGHRATGASHVLSILDPDAPIPEAFGTYGEHEKLELRFHDVIEASPGQQPPEPAHVERLLTFGRNLMAEPQPAAHLLIHCHAGISRSTAAMVLILAEAMPDQPAGAIVASVHDIREKAWPNLRMIEYGDAMLRRHGTLVAATNALHALQIGKRPHIAELMERGGRGREVAAALRVLG